MKKFILIFLLIIFGNAKAFSDTRANTFRPDPGPDSEEPISAANASSLAVIDEDNKRHDGVNLFTRILITIDILFYKQRDMLVCSEQILRSGVSTCTDPYSYYLNKEENEQEQEEIVGEFGGIGIYFEIKKSSAGPVMPVILRVEENSPAEKAGLQPGDLLVAISTAAVNPNWIYFSGLSYWEVIRLMRGPIGTGLTLKILRGDEAKEIPLVRAVIKIKYLESKRLSPNLGYLKITQFFGNSLVKDVIGVLDDFQKNNVKVLIIDLRYNPGGSLDSALGIAELFAKEKNGLMLHTESRTRDREEFRASGSMSGRFKEFKLIILQNQYSASASEILSGYLKEECGATVIGKTSFGKGIVQSLIPLPNGGKLHLTTSEYFIGRNSVRIHEIGVKPTIEAENPAKVEKEENDLQLRRAIEEAERWLINPHTFP